MKYDELDRKAKQLIASEYPYKNERQLWDVTMGNTYQSRKFFDNPQQIQDFKEKAAQDDVSLIKRRDFVVGQEENKAQTVSLLTSHIYNDPQNIRLSWYCHFLLLR